MKAVVYKSDGSIVGQMLVNDDVTNPEHNIACYEEDKFIGRDVIAYDFEKKELVFTNGFKNNEELLKEELANVYATLDDVLAQSLGVLE